MRTLLLHPEDSPDSGPWSEQRWDLIVDLGRSSRSSAQRWSDEKNCPVLRSDAFREGIADARRVREIFSAGSGRLLDEEGFDWWNLTNLRIVPDALTALTLRRVAVEIKAGSEIWSTRANWQANALALWSSSHVRNFGDSGISRSAARTAHYSNLFRHFSMPQIKQIFLDKYDSSYRWRARFASRPKRCATPLVLLPSAYENVSRMAGAYAGLLPQQPFLLIATRWSARQFMAPSNVMVRDLAAYAKSEYPATEIASLLDAWMRVKEDLCSSEEFKMLLNAGILEPFPAWFRDGICARNAWKEVIAQEPVCGVLCGDDNNMFTRLPLLLGTKHGIATASFHHGAFDGQCLIKNLPCDVYLAKNEMERDYLLRICGLAEDRVVIAAPGNGSTRVIESERGDAQAVVFFSEPYEAAGMRGAEVYREILPRLLRLARQSGRELIIKLHPFESRSQRLRIVNEFVSSEDQKRVTILDGPLTSKMLSRAWFGITVESTTVMDCMENGVRCFLCGWLARSSYGYLQQYGRFGVGEELRYAEQIDEIPQRLSNAAHRPVMKNTGAVDTSNMLRWLTCSSQGDCGVKAS